MSKRYCANCMYACGVRRGPEGMLVCANRPDAPGSLTQVRPWDDCPRFCAKRGPVVRVEPPPPPNEHTRLIPLTRGKHAMVDPEDYEWLSQYKWHTLKVRGNFYACRKEGGKTILMHREIMQPPEGKVVDHKNNNSLDNHRSNLRNCDQRQNVWNSRGTGGESGYKGVKKHRDKWLAAIKHKGRTYRLGEYDDPAEAARVRDRKAIELAGEYAWLNFPDGRPRRLIRLKGTIRARTRCWGRLEVIRDGKPVPQPDPTPKEKA